jgi:uncharacterized damage-inducible protein DinB
MQSTDLVRYNHTVRKLYFDSLSKLPWATVVAPRGLSFDSMRNVFLHLTLVEDRWISYIIPGRFSEWVDPDFNGFHSIYELKDYMQSVHRNTQDYLSYLSLKDFNRQIVIPWSEKKLSVETVLTHMVFEDMVHYGELSAALWQMGLEAPYLAFWRYLSSDDK